MYIKGHFITWDKYTRCMWFNSVKVFTDTKNTLKTDRDIKQWMISNFDKYGNEWIRHQKLMNYADSLINELY